MSISFETFSNALKNNPDKELNFYLPDSERIPQHFHITDVGSVVRNFIDCGGQTRTEQYVQIQLWLGADTDHRLTTDTADKILQQSQPVLNLLPDLSHSEVMIEYKRDLISQYPIESIKETGTEINVFLGNLDTQCLAALRHEQDVRNQNASACCSASGCCS